jgi:hypothetical protein
MSKRFDDMPSGSIPGSSGDAGASAGGGDPQDLVAFEIDLTFEEARRRVEVVAALGAGWDPAEALRGEDEAYALLYSGLDAEQERVYRELVEAGVIPPRGGGRAAD